jgi:tetratricopeptide (TPR) repeat protein
MELLNGSLTHLSRALDLLPEDAHDDWAETYDLVGDLFRRVGETERSLDSFRKSLRYWDHQRNVRNAAQTRLRMAYVLLQARQFRDARHFVEMAQRNFRALGPLGAEGVKEAENLLRQLS